MKKVERLITVLKPVCHEKNEYPANAGYSSLSKKVSLRDD